ncbi:hypothetical protein [Paraburkholderia sp. BCC1885]|uniref:hypothetical protein n=1 Tax=Paraburkholderia sp. BCC1885 TaxID=2562669 RepID=UPI001183822F|nr:hypothetical protein [Paraburkholderia sp. BCC1885]
MIDLSDAEDVADACSVLTTHKADIKANAAEVILELVAEVRALRADAARLDWIEARIADSAAVWMLPCGESLRFVQVRHFGECENYPTVEGLRNAIDAARKGQP